MTSEDDGGNYIDDSHAHEVVATSNDAYSRAAHSLRLCVVNASAAKPYTYP